jgi:hypothetical protein
MRFAGKYGRLSVQVQSERTEAYATGAVSVIQRALIAEFKPDGLLPHEREYVLTHWAFNGNYQEMDEATTVPPDYRIGVFDSDQGQRDHNWTEEEKQKVEDELQAIGRHYDHVMLLPKTLVPPPWPNYDDYHGTVAQLMKKLEDDGHDLSKVLEYEKASQNRPPLVEALEAKLYGFDEATPQEETIIA